MARMTMAQFIDENRGELDAAIRRAMKRPNQNLDDEDREEWILNDEGLYNWAKSEGVNVDGDEEEEDEEENDDE